MNLTKIYLETDTALKWKCLCCSHLLVEGVQVPLFIGAKKRQSSACEQNAYFHVSIVWIYANSIEPTVRIRLFSFFQSKLRKYGNVSKKCQKLITKIQSPDQSKKAGPKMESWVCSITRYRKNIWFGNHC